jgi:hypothetical protein
VTFPTTDVEIDYQDEPEVKTPQVERRCATCGGGFKVVDDAKAPPGSYAEAWTPTEIGSDGQPLTRCRGTSNPLLWAWCKVTGNLHIPHRMMVKFFPDRRKDRRDVAIERRISPPPPPSPDDKP